MLWDDTASGPGGPFDIPPDATPALHWDGTYRDRVALLGEFVRFWDETRSDDYSSEMLRAWHVAKHLA